MEILHSHIKHHYNQKHNGTSCKEVEDIWTEHPIYPERKVEWKLKEDHLPGKGQGEVLHSLLAKDIGGPDPALGVSYPHALAVGSNALAGDPQALDGDPQALDGDPQALDGDPQALAGDPHSLRPLFSACGLFYSFRRGEPGLVFQFHDENDDNEDALLWICDVMQ